MATDGQPLPKGVVRGAVGVVLLCGLAVRLLYAWNLPLNCDELSHLRLAREISLRPESFYLPWDSPITGHPLGVVYLTALANWAGGGSVFVIRCVFIALNLVGLWGVYCLGACLFGRRAGLIAMALGAVDRSLVAAAPVFLECPALLWFAPWAMLAMWRCLERGRPRDWLLAGTLFGLSYWFSLVFMAAVGAFGLCILAGGKLKRVVCDRWMYAGVAVMAALVAPAVLEDLFSGGANYARNVGKVATLGLSPRAALLYAGDLLIGLKDTAWVVDNVGGRMYMPMYVPCDWVVGLVYLAAVAVSLWWWRDWRVRFLLVFLAGLAVPVTVIHRREPWNEFTWAGPTVFAAIVLTARLLRGLWFRHIGRALACGVMVYAAAVLAVFLAGPKWGYFSPDREKAYVGQTLYLEFRSLWNAEQFPRREAVEEIRKLTGEFLRRRPDSATAWYYRGLYAEDDRQRQQAFARALQLEPDHPLVLKAEAERYMAAGRWLRARGALERVLAAGHLTPELCRMLAQVEFALGDYEKALRYAFQAASLAPEDRRPDRAMMAIYEAMGDEARAEEARQRYVAKFPTGPAAAYVSLAEGYWKENQPDRAKEMLQRAMRSGPVRAAVLARIGFLLADRLNDTQRAIEYFRAAERRGSRDPVLYYNLGSAMKQKGHWAEAVRYYQQAIQLDPAFPEAQLALAQLLERLGQPGEARRHRQQAQRWAGDHATGPEEPAGGARNAHRQ